MLIITVNDRYNGLIKAVDDLRKTDSRMKTMGTRVIDAIYRFMKFDLGYDWDHSNEEQRKWIFCEFFDKKFYDDARFANRRGVGNGQISYIRAIVRIAQEEG